MKTRVLLGLTLFFVTSAFAKDYRTQKSEVFFMPQFINGKKLEFKNDTAVDIKDRGGFAIGLGYNFDEHFEIAGVFSYTNSSYLATIKKDDGTLENVSRNLYTSTIAVEGTYNFFQGEFTPYISANIGFTYSDTGISTNESSEYCYFDPWWGPVCYDETYTSTDLNYGASVGVRYDFQNSLYLKAGIGTQYVDYDSKASPYFTTYSITIGGRF